MSLVTKKARLHCSSTAPRNTRQKLDKNDSAIETLPIELHCQCLAFLNIVDLYRGCGTSKSWYRIVRETSTTSETLYLVSPFEWQPHPTYAQIMKWMQSCQPALITSIDFYWNNNSSIYDSKCKISAMQYGAQVRNSHELGLLSNVTSIDNAPLLSNSDCDSLAIIIQNATRLTKLTVHGTHQKEEEEETQKYRNTLWQTIAQHHHLTLQHLDTQGKIWKMRDAAIVIPQFTALVNLSMAISDDGWNEEFIAALAKNCTQLEVFTLELMADMDGMLGLSTFSPADLKKFTKLKFLLIYDNGGRQLEITRDTNGWSIKNAHLNEYWVNTFVIPIFQPMHSLGCVRAAHFFDECWDRLDVSCLKHFALRVENVDESSAGDSNWLYLQQFLSRCKLETLILAGHAVQFTHRAHANAKFHCRHLRLDMENLQYARGHAVIQDIFKYGSHLTDNAIKVTMISNDDWMTFEIWRAILKQGTAQLKICIVASYGDLLICASRSTNTSPWQMIWWTCAVGIANWTEERCQDFKCMMGRLQAQNIIEYCTEIAQCKQMQEMMDG